MWAAFYSLRFGRWTQLVNPFMGQELHSSWSNTGICCERALNGLTVFRGATLVFKGVAVLLWKLDTGSTSTYTLVEAVVVSV